jgi:hypothetical protein
LEICNNNLADLYGIHYLKSLRNLVLRENYINKIDSIEGLNLLTYLDLSNNVLRIVDKTNIGFLPSLKTLICGENYLKNVNAFNKLSTLCYISFENNKITDYSHVEKLNQLECLKELNLINNPITKEYNYRLNMVRRFLMLNKIDGLEINKEEREMILLELQELNEQESEVNNMFNLPTIKDNKKEANMKVKYVNLGLFNMNTPKGASVNDIQIINAKDIFSKGQQGYTNVVGKGKYNSRSADAIVA